MESPTVTMKPGKKWSRFQKTARPKAVALSQEKWVRISSLFDDEELSLLVQPNMKEVDLIEWAGQNREFIETKLRRHGGLLFRGFGLKNLGDFEGFIGALDLPLLFYTEGATPRAKLSRKIYTSTEFPNDQSIFPHNELNYVMTWPMKIWFFCEVPASVGGETPVVDVRRVYNRLDPTIRQKFEEKGWMLTRNFGDGFSLTWQDSYRVETREELEQYCKSANVEYEWKGENRLRCRQVRPAVAKHIKTGEMVWFNHIAFWHVSSLEPGLREMLLQEYGEENLPYNTYYGDGSPIEDSVVEELRQAYDAEMFSFPWQAGDLLMLDNVLVAHGRNPFEGDRRILTAMAEPCDDRNLDGLKRFSTQ